MRFLRVCSVCAAGVLATSLAMFAQTYTLIYSFGASPDGANPHRAVAITSGGTLYGTTVYGGASGYGTIYELVPGGGGSWTESIIQSFANDSGDGGEPDGDLLWNGTAIYGTTSIGGSSGDGTVFRAKETSGVWSESPIYNFAGPTGDGAGPFAGVIASGGVLYGTTFYGGANSDGGSAYSLTPSGNSWTEALLYSFGASASDGVNPHAPLVYAGSGVFYGTTYNGGASSSGTVYELVDSGGTWTETVLYSFSGGSDGSNPHSGLVIDGSGVLYGTTVLGGSHGKGVVYSLTSAGGGSWTEAVLHNFKTGTNDGEQPRAGVIFGSSTSTLYGATVYGGSSANCTNGCGTVYELTYSGGSWTETILYSFTGSTSSDGAEPYSDLIYSGGTLYGTTYVGGASNNGTVYSVVP
jgi:uncharacterized repeat protein (TIGR03803 family)